ncbi:Na(+)-translocating NADH-quinone reductase subunit A [candidate division KSB1 bacterium]|nr:Na(+)-translocating NADH-quinone reductase subunit A [candidate division KSB1 bacterium]RQW02211.1 MAG: Na(+)-translocating NADH-quinone reductase subunit A [candidate division KSB1 bacterium]
MTKIKKGLNVPIAGEPEQVVYDGYPVSHVAVLGPDYIGMKPTMQVAVGDTVKLGGVLFTDKIIPEVIYTAPGAGKIVAINRGHKRALLSVVIQLQGDEEVSFPAFAASSLDDLDTDTIKKQLLDSGQWVALRSRPFSKVADPRSTPHSIFITAMDTNPLAPSVDEILRGKETEFQAGVTLLTKLTEGKVYLCKSPGMTIPGGGIARVMVEEFSGPHPAGLAGTHIHFLDPVSRTKTVWTIHARDVAAFGTLFLTGRIDVERIVALAGPAVINPRLLKTRLGASLNDLTSDELKDGVKRIVSGSVISGFHAKDALAFLGRYHHQVSVLPEGGERKMFGWMTPRFDLFSLKNVVGSKFLPGKKFDFTTNINGSVRPIIPSGNYEAVMPLDILPTPLLRALAINDVEEAEKLGCYELDEEDLALCTYVCPGKIDHGANLRNTLTLIEKEG